MAKPTSKPPLIANQVQSELADKQEEAHEQAATVRDQFVNALQISSQVDRRRRGWSGDQVDSLLMECPKGFLDRRHLSF
jgi:hypothetical protein